MSSTIASSAPRTLDVSRRRGWKIRRPEANRLEAGVHAALRVMRRPARLILKEAHGANAPVAAQIEPVMGALRHANQISTLDFDCEHGTIGRVNMKQAATFDDETHFVFVV